MLRQEDAIVGGENVSTGVDGLDDVLAGGYSSNRIHLIEGQPGAGKTTLALQFLLAGREEGDRSLYITLSETRAEIIHSAGTHGWSLDGLNIFELVPPELSLDPSREQSVYYSSDLELGETIKMVIAEVERVAPARVVFDSLSEIRLLAQGALRYRRQVLALKHFFAQRDCTVLFLDDLTQEMDDLNLHSLAHGVVRLEHVPVEYGAARRRLRVFKMRGRDFRGGFHDIGIRPSEGVVVYPRLVAAEHEADVDDSVPVPSGIEELDLLFGGGVDRGTATLIVGAAGAGKSTVCLQWHLAALARDERTLYVSFDETERVFLKRARGMGIDLTEAVASGAFTYLAIDPAELAPGEFASIVRDHVERRGVRMIAIDSLSGYHHAMPDEGSLLLQMHELLSYLNYRGVVTQLVLAQHGLVGRLESTVDLSYLSDNVVLLRFFEAGGELKRAMSIMKKRTGGHEATIREYRIDSQGVRVGDPLVGFQGVLSGVPSYSGTTGQFLPDRDALPRN